MNAGRAVRAIAKGVIFPALAGTALSAIVFAAPPQVQVAPQPVLRTSNPPRQPPQNPKTDPGATPHHELYTALEFNIWTGDDDLRSESWVWADVAYPDGTKDRCEIHPPTGDSWGNNSKHRANQCVLTKPRRWIELKDAKIVMSLTSRDDINTGFNFDNWNVNEVRVVAIDPADKHYPCLIDARASPYLVRMKATQSSYDLTNTENSC